MVGDGRLEETEEEFCLVLDMANSIDCATSLSERGLASVEKLRSGWYCNSKQTQCRSEEWKNQVIARYCPSVL